MVDEMDEKRALLLMQKLQRANEEHRGLEIEALRLRRELESIEQLITNCKVNAQSVQLEIYIFTMESF